MSLPRFILHLDADAFFVGCELSGRPDLRSRPVAVGGGEGRGIIASASYEARKLGVYTPMPTSRALRVCPELLVLPGNYPKYEEFSRKMFGLVRALTPLVEVGSIDEGYADLSGLTSLIPREAALGLKEELGNQLGLSVSIGLGSNKFVSSVASKLYKPDNFLEIPAGEEVAFLSPLGVQWLPGVGAKMEVKLRGAGFATIGDVAAASLEDLGAIVGAGAESMRNFARGLDARPVVPDPEPAQSYGQQETFGKTLTDKEEARIVLRGMAGRLMRRIRQEGKMVRCIELRVRYADRQMRQYQESLPEPTDLETDTYHVVDRLLDKAWDRAGLRLLGLSFSRVCNIDALVQAELTLPGDSRKARRSLARTMDDVHRRFGTSSLVRARLLGRVIR